jgi:hypothetical protein
MDTLKLTERHLEQKASEILEDARRLGYFRFKCRVQGDAVLLMFAKGGSVHYERQVGWMRFWRKGERTGVTVPARCQAFHPERGRHRAVGACAKDVE